MSFPIDLQKNMARTQRLVKKSDFFTNGLILVIHTIYQLLVMIWKLLHHLKHPSAYWHAFLVHNYFLTYIHTVHTLFVHSGHPYTIKGTSGDSPGPRFLLVSTRGTSGDSPGTLFLVVSTQGTSGDSPGISS